MDKVSCPSLLFLTKYEPSSVNNLVVREWEIDPWNSAPKISHGASFRVTSGHTTATGFGASCCSLYTEKCNFIVLGKMLKNLNIQFLKIKTIVSCVESLKLLYRKTLINF